MGITAASTSLLTGTCSPVRGHSPHPQPKGAGQKLLPVLENRIKSKPWLGARASSWMGADGLELAPARSGPVPLGDGQGTLLKTGPLPPPAQPTATPLESSSPAPRLPRTPAMDPSQVWLQRGALSWSPPLPWRELHLGGGWRSVGSPEGARHVHPLVPLIPRVPEPVSLQGPRRGVGPACPAKPRSRHRRLCLEVGVSWRGSGFPQALHARP